MLFIVLNFTSIFGSIILHYRGKKQYFCCEQLNWTDPWGCSIAYTFQPYKIVLSTYVLNNPSKGGLKSEKFQN